MYNQIHKQSGRWMLVLALVSMVGAVIGGYWQPVIPATTRAGLEVAEIRERYGQLPLHFEANRGQTDRAVRFLARGSGYTLFLTPEEAVLSLRRNSNMSGTAGQKDVVRLSLAGAAAAPAMFGDEPMATRSHYLTNSTAGDWTTNVPSYGRVTYRSVYPGIDWVFYGNQRQLEYDFVVAPGADPEAIRLSYEGIKQLHLDQNGNLVLDVPGGQLIQRAPYVYQEINGRRHVVTGSYTLDEQNRVGFRVGSYQAGRPLIIDPVLVYIQPLGGSGYDAGSDIAIDAAGNAYIVGATDSVNFPVRNAFQPNDNPDYDAFVAKLNPAGSQIVYSTYLGGNGYDWGDGIAVDTAGNAYVVGHTTSTNFPTLNAFQPTRSGPGDAFVVKLGATGSSLIYATYLGGKDLDEAYAIALDANRNAYVTGMTRSGNFPTHNAYQPAHANPGANDAFVTKLSATGSTLAYSTFLGGNGADSGRGIALDAGRNAYITGETSSTTFPTRNPLQGANEGESDAFVTKLNAAGSNLVYSTYLGGEGHDASNDIALDTDRNAYITGRTDSVHFPVENPLSSLPGGMTDGFVSKINTAGSALVYSTYLGGLDEDRANGIAVDTARNAYVTGHTSSLNFPTVPCQENNCLPVIHGNAFVVKLVPTGSELSYAFFISGMSDAEGFGIAVNSAGNAFVTGVMPEQYTLNDDAFVLKLSAD
jgi:hypothetical protein